MVDAVDLVKGDIQRDFERALKKIKKPADTIAGAQDYAQAVGGALVEAFRKNIGEDILVDGFLTPDLAEALIKDPMIAGWRFVTSKTADIQTAINNQAGYSIRALLAKTDERRVDGMVTLASEKPFAEVSTKFYQATPKTSASLLRRRSHAAPRSLPRMGHHGMGWNARSAAGGFQLAWSH